MSLKVDIYPRNMELTDRISEYVTKKVSKLDRFLNDVDETRVDLDFQKSMRSPADRQVAQITLRGRGYILRTEERSDDLFAAVDSALEKMQRKIERYKGKRSHGRGDGISAGEIAQETSDDDEPETMPVIARRKTFTMIPMDELEAIEQMNRLGHENFFVFYNANTSSVNVLYLRRDGTYGMIEPVLG